MSKTDDCLNAANALVCVIGTVTADAVVPGAGTALSGGASLSYLRKRLTGRAPDINRRLALQLHAALTQPTTPLPPDAPLLIPQMIERATLAPSDIMADRLNATAIAEAMLRKLTDPEHKRPEIRAAFLATVTPALDTLLNDPATSTALQPAFQQATAETLGFIAEQVQGLEELNQKYGSIVSALDELGQLRLRDLQVLAFQFGLTPAPDATPGALVGMLQLKASEWKDLRERLDLLRQEETALSNQLAEVEALMEQGHFDRADAILSQAEELQDERILGEVRKKTRLRLTRGQSALLQGDVATAASHFRLAADILQPLNLTEAAEARNTGQNRLWAHGLRYGGTALKIAAEMLRQNTECLDPRRNADQWGGAQNNLGTVLQEQGTRTGGPEGAALLGQAVAAYGEALTVRTRADHPVQWAMTQNNLANALQEQGTRTGGPDGAALLGQAVAAYGEALTVRTRADHPVDWAMTQNNLAAALQQQGTRTGGPEGAALLGQAVAAYGEALTVRTRADHPVQWAMTRENMAIAEQALASHDATADPAKHLRAALAHVEAALEVYDPEHMPYNHTKATALRAALRARIGAADPAAPQAPSKGAE